MIVTATESISAIRKSSLYTKDTRSGKVFRRGVRFPMKNGLNLKATS